MASSTIPTPGPNGTTDVPQLGEMTPSSPLEMTSFMTPPESNSPQDPTPPTLSSTTLPNPEPIPGPSTRPADQSGLDETQIPPQSSKPTVSSLQRRETEAIGPSSDDPPLQHDSSTGPAVMITLLLTSGARHPYKVDEKYLRRRNVSVDEVDQNGAMDPFAISVYTLKELIWRDWREDWEAKPNNPSAIRLIHFGRMLDDKMALKGG
ncbi:MAG: hypothetical protein Q9165_005521 [Trypethelium subeluteriae]